MIKRTKSLYLKKFIAPKLLQKEKFYSYDEGKSYVKDIEINGKSKMLCLDTRTNRVYIKYPKETRARILIKYIDKHLLEFCEQRVIYEYKGDFMALPLKKRLRIGKRLEKLNNSNKVISK